MYLQNKRTKGGNMYWLKKLYCRIFGHTFYRATIQMGADKTKCKNCNKWFDVDKAYGRWI